MGTPRTSLSVISFLVQKIKDSSWRDVFKGITNFFFLKNLFDCCFALIVYLRKKAIFTVFKFKAEGRNWKPLVLLLGFSVLWRHHILLFSTIKVKKSLENIVVLMGMYHLGTPAYCCKDFWSGIRGQSLSSAFKQKEVNYFKRPGRVLNRVIKRRKCTWHWGWVWHCQIAHAVFIVIHHFLQLLSKAQGKKKNLSE